MKLTTRGRYGTRALLEIALHHGEQPVPLKEIAEKQHISLTYLEHLITPLVQGGILRSVRGVGGGVSLARAPEDIRLSEVIRLLEGSLAPAGCVSNPGICSRSPSCATHDIWSEVAQAVDRVLESVTLQNLVERQKQKQQPMYHI